MEEIWGMKEESTKEIDGEKDKGNIHKQLESINSIWAKPLFLKGEGRELWGSDTTSFTHHPAFKSPRQCPVNGDRPACRPSVVPLKAGDGGLGLTVAGRTAGVVHRHGGLSGAHVERLLAHVERFLATVIHHRLKYNLHNNKDYDTTTS